MGGSELDRRLPWLETMRAVAACWVLAHHANQYVGYYVAPFGQRLATIFTNGYLGVDFFFVLSGFIIALSSERLRASGRGFTDYVKARLIRIYVPYLPVGIGMLLLLLFVPGLSTLQRSPGMLTSLTLLPSASLPALSVAWTLTHELLFYALFSLYFISRRALFAALAAWGILILGLWFLGHTPELPAKYLLDPVNLCFLLGVALYYLTRGGLAVGAGVALAGAALGVAAIGLEAGLPRPERWLLALGFAGLIVCASSPWAGRYAPARWMLALGAASYSIYLVHTPVLGLAIRAVATYFPGAAPSVAFVAISAVALAAGILYYRVYERPALSAARRLGAAPPATASAAVPLPLPVAAPADSIILRNASND